ncbi:uncharacterized protein [Diabrotica undecimpunctata]|uniref:uncharacterized protein n=1 Tax=Diabrotica undecimpunctata TaxID=50387 RepID=UPI003B638952
MVGLSEVRRRGEHLIKIKSGDSFYNVGDDNNSLEGNGFIIHKCLQTSIVLLKKFSTRVICLTLKLNTRYNMKIIQVYEPTTDYDKEEVNLFYDDIEAALKDHQGYFTFL